MKLTVTKYLNVRVGKPSVNAPCYKYLTPGSVIEVEGERYKGDLYNENRIWYKDALGNYFWSGGLKIPSPEEPFTIHNDKDVIAFKSVASFPEVFIDYNSKVAKLPQGFRDTLGAGIKIAVLDTGIEKRHQDLKSSTEESIDFTQSKSGDLDKQGHGTAMASLIAADSIFVNGIRGVVPKSRLFSAKVMYDENDPQDFLSVGMALDHFTGKGIDIVNLSIGRDSVVKEVADKISNSPSTIFFAATREYSAKPGDLLNLFPANHLGVIPICALPKEYIDTFWNQLPSGLVIVPLYKVWCASIRYDHYYIKDSGSSISTALISGIAALILSHKSKVKRTKDAILNELKRFRSTPDEAFKNFDTEIHYMIKD